MGNFNNNRHGNNGGNKKPQRYRGKNVHPLSGPVQMRQHAARLIKNIAFGNFTLEQDGIYFQNHEFVMAALNECEEKIKIQNIYNLSLNCAYGMSDDITVLKMINDHKRALDAWSLSYNIMAGILNTGDISLLVSLMHRLPDYRYVM